jgi:hypothetical protein
MAYFQSSRFLPPLAVWLAQLCATHLWATPAVGTPVVTPTSVIAGQATPVKATCEVTTVQGDPALLTGGVNLVRLSSTGTDVSIVGVMTAAGGGSYSYSFTDSEPGPGQYEFQCTAAFSATIRRVRSTPAGFTVSPGTQTYTVSSLTFAVLDSASPAVGLQTYSISGLPFSILNSVSPASGLLTHSISGLPFSTLNSVSPASGLQTHSISGLPFSILNSVSPAPAGTQTTHSISGLPFSVRNSVSPAAAGPQTYSISGLPFSILNGVSPAPATPLTYAAFGLTFSIFNGSASQPGPAPTATPQAAPSLSFRIPIDPVFLKEALARGAQTINGKPVCMDSDGDGLCDSDELIIGTNPFVADTDGDGYPDGLELRLGSDPLNPNSIPDLRPPGYFATPPVSIFNTILMAGPSFGRQGAFYAKNNR